MTVRYINLHFSLHLHLIGLEPVDGEQPMCVMHGQCNAVPMVILEATRHHCPLGGTNLLLGDFLTSLYHSWVTMLPENTLAPE